MKKQHCRTFRQCCFFYNTKDIFRYQISKTGSFWRFAIKAILLIFLVEVVQLFALLGVFDVDDIILNVLGMSFGYFLYFLFMRRVER